MTKKILAYFVIVLVSFGIAFHFVHGNVYKHFWKAQIIKIEKFTGGQAGEPEQFRVLQYALITGIYLAGIESVLTGVQILHGVVVILAFIAIYHYYKRLGVRAIWLALTLAAYPIIYSHAKSGMAEGYYIELPLYLWGLLAIFSRRWWLVLALTAIGSVNRETIFMLPVVGFVMAQRIQDRPGERFMAGALLLVVAVQVALRAYMPQSLFTPTPDGIPQGLRMIAHNLSPVYILYFLGFLGFIPLAWRGWPMHIWPVTLIVPVYFAGMLVFGNIVETRMLMLPMIAVMIPAAFEISGPVISS